MLPAVAIEKTVDALVDDLASYLNKHQVNQVRRAFYYAQQAHDGQIRQSGEPYVTHPLAVATILSEMHMDPVSHCSYVARCNRGYGHYEKSNS